MGDNRGPPGPSGSLSLDRGSTKRRREQKRPRPRSSSAAGLGNVWRRAHFVVQMCVSIQVFLGGGSSPPLGPKTRRTHSLARNGAATGSRHVKEEEGWGSQTNERTCVTHVLSDSFRPQI